MVLDLGSSRGESITSKVGFCPGNVQERLARAGVRPAGHNPARQAFLSGPRGLPNFVKI